MGMTAKLTSCAACFLWLAWAALPVEGQSPDPPAPSEGQHDSLPTRLEGGTVIATDRLAELVEDRGTVLIDVAPEQRRPPGQSAQMPWLPRPHRSIPGSTWIPGAGIETVSAAMADYFRSRLAELTGRDPERPIVIFCHPQCGLSLNAAKRAIVAGYRRVAWYPGGVEAWQDAGRPTVAVKPEGPDAE